MESFRYKSQSLARAHHQFQTKQGGSSDYWLTQISSLKTDSLISTSQSQRVPMIKFIFQDDSQSSNLFLTQSKSSQKAVEILVKTTSLPETSNGRSLTCQITRCTTNQPSYWQKVMPYLATTMSSYSQALKQTKQLTCSTDTHSHSSHSFNHRSDIGK